VRFGWRYRLAQSSLMAALQSCFSAGIAISPSRYRVSENGGTNVHQPRCLRFLLTRLSREHILSDLQPFVCTYPGCHLENYLFSTVDAWFGHETETHRVEFFCQTPGHKPSTSQTEFREHLSKDHALILGSSEDELLAFQRPIKSPYGNCNLCLAGTSNVKRHVSRHLRQFALFALPRADYYMGDEDGDTSTQAMQYSGASSSTPSFSDTDSVPRLARWNSLDPPGVLLFGPSINIEEEPSAPPATEELSSWEDIQTYGVLAAREDRSEQPPDSLPKFISEPAPTQHIPPKPQTGPQLIYITGKEAHLFLAPFFCIEI
jgi:hypothetical protein